MARYLIDGHNLLHAVREQGLGPAPARDTLCRLVADWARRSRAEATVVFDGSPPPTGVAQQLRHLGLTVWFAGRHSADAVIENEVARSSAPGEIVVVTTDRAIQHAVRYRRARTIDAEEFAAKLYEPPQAAPPHTAAEPDEKPDGLTSDEAAEWIDRFGERPEDLPDG